MSTPAPDGPLPPPWAAAWGDDEQGAWADLAVGLAVQRLRWIAPGEFMMGSPGSEAGGFEREGPQHRVRISRGFWLANTPCTQGFWRALTGKEPSRFKGDDELPVESVDWKEVQEALTALSETMPPGLQAVLPTEAEWEYAARAGSPEAYAFGQHLQSSDANFDGMVGQTSPVKRYRANAWGLHDCHGNVWEWCADGLRDYAATAKSLAALVDPGLEAGPAAAPDADRVLRGGSWFSSARDSRCACRRADPPGDRYGNLGFRFALRSTSPGGPEGPHGPGTGP